jgi:RNA polymerase sigma factor (sigma-70 family)
MASATILMKHIGGWVGALAVDGRPDRELLRRFTRDGDGQAFAALLRRHGPMAWAACRRVLPNTADAEDVLQKTFLLLAQKAAGLRDHDSVGGWLYGVAYRLALRARSEAVVRADREGRTPPRAPPDPLADITRRETQQLFDEALARLPEKCRAVLVLCCLEGRTQGEAARQLGCSLSTLKRRLEEGRTRLGQQLVRQGVTLPAAALAATLAPRTNAALPPALTAAVLRAVTGVPSAGVVGRAVGGLLVSRRRFAVAALAIPVAVAAGGVAFWTASRRDDPPVPPDPTPPVPGRVVPRPGFDLAGDPLPDGAIARIGTTRFRYAGSIRSLVFTADGKRLLSFGSYGNRENNFIRVWDLDTGDEQHTRLADADIALQPWRVSSLSSDGKWGATIDPEGAHIWDLTSGKKVKDIGQGWYDSEKAGGHLNDLAILSPDGRVLALAGNNTVSTWDVATEKRLATLQLPPGKEGPHPNRGGREPSDPNFLAFTGDGKTLMTADENAVLFWEAATGKMLHHFTDIAADQTNSIALSADGKLIAGFTPAGRNLCIFDAANGKVLHKLEPPVLNEGFGGVAFSPDGKVLACSTSQVGPNDRGGVGDVVYLWDTATGKELHRLTPLGLYSQRYGLGRLMAFSPDGTRLAVTLDTGGGGLNGAWPDWHVIQVYDVASGKELPLTAGLPQPASRAVLAPDGKTVATIWNEDISSIFLWDSTTGEQLRRLEGDEGRVYGLLFSPDGRTLFSTHPPPPAPPSALSHRTHPPARLGRRDRRAAT